MEKFSAYRDAGTGIQPFLTPVPPASTDILSKGILPLRLILGVLRTLLVLILALAYVVLVNGICLVLYPIPPIHRIFEHIFTYILGRSALLVLGVFWVSVEQFNRKRSRGPKTPEKWDPKAGDIIISNWASWLDIVWLALRFNPTFVVPVPESIPEYPSQSKSSTPIAHTPGRRTGTGSANIQTASRTPVTRIPIRGFQEVSFFQMIRLTGLAPPYRSSLANDSLPLEEIRRKASKPLVVFPECTSSNGRGLLRFASVFRQEIPTKNFRVFVMSVRYDPPTPVAPTLTLSMPSNFMNPIPHLFSIATSLSAAQITIRLLAPSESPSSQLFLASEVLSDYSGDDQLSETCAILIAQMGKMKQTGMGWEDKSNFFEFYKK